MKKLFDLKKFGTSGFEWKIFDSEDADYAHDCGRQYEAAEYRTDSRGEGLWEKRCVPWRDENERQIRGTCQYSACATISGQRRKIKRELVAE